MKPSLVGCGHWCDECGNKTQLFDLQNDPNEITNLAEKPEYAVKVKDLFALMARELRQFGDTAPLTVEKIMPSEWIPSKKMKE